MKNKEIKMKEKKELQVVNQQTHVSMFFEKDRFELAQRVGKMFAESTMVPDRYRGKVGDCVIALSMSERMGLDPLLVMSKVYVLKGTPGMEGQLVIALVNKSGLFTPLEFELSGKDDALKCVCFAIRKFDKKRIEANCTMAMANAEGWTRDKKSRDGKYTIPSKWKTMPEVMIRYRAASFFGRFNCPEALFGMQTVEEIEDIENVQVAEFEVIQEQEINNNQIKIREEKKKAEAAGEMGDPVEAIEPEESETAACDKLFSEGNKVLESSAMPTELYLEYKKALKTAYSDLDEESLNSIVEDLQKKTK